MSNKDSLTFIEHLDELRGRVFISLLTLTVLSLIAYYFRVPLLDILTRPAKASIPHFYFLSPHDAFMIQIKLALCWGFFFAIPVLFYQTWLFIQPGLAGQEKFKLLLLSLLVSFLFFCGALFSYFGLLPWTVQFLMGFQSADLLPMITFDKYVNFIVSLLFGSGVLFQTPLLIYFLSKLGIVSAGALAVHRGNVLIGIVIVAAVLTPPDVVSQIMLAVPMYALFEISVFIVRHLEKHRK